MNKNISILKMSILKTAKPNVVNMFLSLYKKLHSRFAGISYTFKSYILLQVQYPFEILLDNA